MGQKQDLPPRRQFPRRHRPNCQQQQNQETQAGLDREGHREIKPHALRINFPECITGIEIRHVSYVGQFVEVRLWQQMKTPDSGKQPSVVRPRQRLHQLRVGRIHRQVIGAQLVTKSVERPEHADRNDGDEHQRPRQTNCALSFCFARRAISAVVAPQNLAPGQQRQHRKHKDSGVFR